MLKKLGYKDKKFRAGFKKTELFSLFNKALKKNLDFYSLDSEDIPSPKSFSVYHKVRIRNRCLVTSRGRGVVSQFKISRMVFRAKAGAGLLPGLSKTN